MNTHAAALLLVAATFAGCAVGPQDPPQEKPPADAAAPQRWEVEGYALQFSVPGQDDFIAPVIIADRGPLHLEGRYNYEDNETASLWIGRNFTIDGDVAVAVTPMAGLVVGETDGIAPGLRLDMEWRRFDASSEIEYVIDFDDEDDSFCYSWTEIGFSPTEWLRAGVVGQRTRVYRTEHEVDRGLLLQVFVGPVDLTLYSFEPWDNDHYWAFTIGASF